MDKTERQFFAENGYLNLGKVLSDAEVERHLAFYDRDWDEFGYFWKPLGHHQTINCHALVSWPEIDELIRHPRLVAPMQDLMGGPICFSEICVRHMAPYEGTGHQGFHRDRPHWLEHPLRMDYIQVMLYLSDVGPETHCFSLSPESIHDEILEKEKQLEKAGSVDMHGPAGSAVIFNVSVLHAATVRPTQQQRKTVQTYYGHPQRSWLSNDSVIPTSLWRDNFDPEVQSFYGNLNPKSRAYAAAFGAGSVLQGESA